MLLISHAHVPSITESRTKLDEKKRELSTVEATYNERLAELQRTLDKETEARKVTEADLAKVRKQGQEQVEQ